MNSHAGYDRSVSKPLAVGCGCNDWRLQQLVEGVDVDARVERARGVEETMNNVVEDVSRSYPSWLMMQQRQEAAAARRRG